MTRSVETDPEASWAIEIEQEGKGSQTEFYSVVAFRAGPEEVQILTPGGTQVSFKTRDIRKVLLMKVVDKETVDAS